MKTTENTEFECPEGCRMTKQRRVILDYLRAVDTHPTAEAVYTAVRKDLKNISLGTVYRTLEFLHQNDCIKKIDTGKVSHYDANLTSCGHFICRNCDAVKTIPGVTQESLRDSTKRKLARLGKVKLIQLNVFGDCYHCHEHAKA